MRRRLTPEVVAAACCRGGRVPTLSPVKRVTVIATVCAALLASGTAFLIDAREPPPRARYPKPTPPPPANNVFAEVKEPAPSQEEIEKVARERPALLQQEIESALATGDAQRRETVFTFLLPELLQVDPARVVDMVDRLEPGRKRDLLRDEVARQWIGRDADAAIAWMKSLQPEAEQRAAAREAIEALVHYDLRLASVVAERFRVGRDREAVTSR
jgi:hypothetical protein